MGIFRKRKKKKKEWKTLQKVKAMTDEDFLKAEKHLYIMSGLLSGSGIIIFILCIVILILL